MKSDWQGKFGDNYTVRNTPDVGLRYRIFDSILQDICLGSITEFGCNKGVNMFALNARYPEAYICGVEVNKEVLKAGVPPFAVSNKLGWNTDLVFTCGVLIHIPPKDLKRTMKNIIKHSKKFVLAIEYFSEDEKEVVYRGKKNMLWKRDFGKLYQDLGLKLISTGEVPEIDNSTYWLFRK